MLLDTLNAAGYPAQLTAKGRYIRGVLPLLGGQFGLTLLQHEPLLRLFSHAQIRKGQAYTLAQLTQIAEPAAQAEAFREDVAQLAASGALLRGYRLQCPTCDLDSWYAIDAIAEETICVGCRNPFQLPLMQAFAFRPNRLLAEALKSGALTVLLTLHHWLQDTPVTMWQANLHVRDGSTETDLDLLVLREDGLFLAECKDNFATDDDSLEHLKAQTLRAQGIAQAIDATMVFATLYAEALPATLHAFFKQHDITVLDRKTLLTD